MGTSLTSREFTLLIIPYVTKAFNLLNEIIDFQALVRWGTIDESDVDLLYFSDSVEDAFNYLVHKLDRDRKNKKKRK